MQVDNVEMMDQENAMDQVHATGKAFFEALAKWDGEDLQGGIITDLLSEHCSKESGVQLAFQLLTKVADPNDCAEPFNLNRESKAFALHFAETVGPDWAQWLYHFAKLVTKLA